MDKIFVIGKDAVPGMVRLGAGETLHWTFVVPQGVSCNFPVDIELDGEGAEADIAGIYLCDGSENVRIDILLRHNAASCRSVQVFKGIVGGKARAEFKGLVYVGQGAMKTKASQENHTILLGRDAFVQSEPQLEIYADDVECSHGSTTGFLNTEEQFYMQSRGIPEKEARRLQMISFISDVASRLPEELKEQIYDSLS